MDGARGEDEPQVIKYMKNRPVYECSLEEPLGSSPFESYTLFRYASFAAPSPSSCAHMFVLEFLAHSGESSGTSLFGHAKKSHMRPVGIFKVGVVRCCHGDP